MFGASIQWVSIFNTVPVPVYTVPISGMVYCGKNVITSRISGSDKYQQVILVVQWGECSPIVEGIMKVLAPSGLSR